MGKLHINKGEKMFINLFIYSDNEENAKKNSKRPIKK